VLKLLRQMSEISAPMAGVTGSIFIYLNSIGEHKRRP
jgi:hypothetical protein